MMMLMLMLKRKKIGSFKNKKKNVKKSKQVNLIFICFLLKNFSIIIMETQRLKMILANCLIHRLILYLIIKMFSQIYKTPIHKKYTITFMIKLNGFLLLMMYMKFTLKFKNKQIKIMAQIRHHRKILKEKKKVKRKKRKLILVKRLKKKRNKFLNINFMGIT